MYVMLCYVKQKFSLNHLDSLSQYVPLFLRLYVSLCNCLSVSVFVCLCLSVGLWVSVFVHLCSVVCLCQLSIFGTNLKVLRLGMHATAAKKVDKCSDIIQRLYLNCPN